MPSSLIAYLGPAGSWTHQACLDLFGEKDLVPLDQQALLNAYVSGKVAHACIPVTTTIVGATPYLDAVLDLPGVTVVAEYCRMLSYNLLALPGTRREDIKEVLAHPVAFEEVRPWLEREMPNALRTEMASGGAAAQAVASSSSPHRASFGPLIGASVYGLVSLADGIEEGPHNVTRWWVLGRTMPAPTGHDKTSFVVHTADHDGLGTFLSSLNQAEVQVLAIDERPCAMSLGQRRYLLEVAGHRTQGKLSQLLQIQSNIQVLGSYPRSEVANPGRISKKPEAESNLCPSGLSGSA